MRILLAALATLIMTMLTYLPAQAARRPVIPTCMIASEGIYNGFWVKHRIVIQEDIVYGANDLDSILSQLEALREEGLCR